MVNPSFTVPHTRLSWRRIGTTPKGSTWLWQEIPLDSGEQMLLHVAKDDADIDGDSNTGSSFLLTILCPTVLLCAISLDCFSAIRYALWGIGVAILLPGVAIVLLYRGGRRGVSSYTRIGWTLLGIAVFSVLLHLWIVGIQEERSMADGDVLCEALSTFKEDNNRFPEELAQLVPEYLERLPTTSMGLLFTRPFFYYRNDWTGGYTLGFHSLNWTNWERDEVGDWGKGY